MRSEWFAFQFTRVVAGETEEMDASLLAKMRRMLDFVRNLVREWMGDPSLTTAELDRQILDWLGWKKRERSDSSAAAAKPAQSAAPQTAAQQASTRQPAAATGNVFIVRPAASTAAPQSTATEPATEKPPALTEEEQKDADDLREALRGTGILGAPVSPSARTARRLIAGLDLLSPKVVSWRDARYDEYSEKSHALASAHERNFNTGNRMGGAGKQARFILQTIREVGTSRQSGGGVSELAPNFGEQVSVQERARVVVRAFEQALKKHIIFYKNATGEWSGGAVTFKGYPNYMMVNTEAGTLLTLSLIGHEFTHQVKEQRPELWRRMRKLIYDTVGAADSAYKADRRMQGYRDEELTDEWVSDVVGDRWAEPEFWGEVGAAAERRGLGAQFREFAQAALDMVNHLLGTVATMMSGVSNAGNRAAIKRLRAGLADMLAEFAEGMPQGGYADMATGSTSTATRGSLLGAPIEVTEEGRADVARKLASGWFIQNKLFGDKLRAAFLPTGNIDVAMDEKEADGKAKKLNDIEAAQLLVSDDIRLRPVLNAVHVTETTIEGSDGRAIIQIPQ